MEPKNSVGRPKLYKNNAEKQKEYRRRLKASGKRVISATVTDVRDTTKPLKSSIIDLSAVKKW